MEKMEEVKEGPFQTDQEKLILYLERTTLFQMLKDFFEGAEPTKKDFEVIESIMVKHKLPPGVVNVLCYVYHQWEVNSPSIRGYSDNMVKEKNKISKRSNEMG